MQQYNRVYVVVFRVARTQGWEKNRRIEKGEGGSGSGDHPYITPAHFWTFLDPPTNYVSLNTKLQKRKFSEPPNPHPVHILKEVQIVYRLFLMNCYLLHVPRLPSQPASNAGC